MLRRFHSTQLIHEFHIKHIDKVGHVAAAPGPLACPSRGQTWSVKDGHVVAALGPLASSCHV